MRTELLHTAVAAALVVPSAAPLAGSWVIAPSAAQVDFQCSGHAMNPVAEGVIIRANAFSSCIGGPGWRPQRVVIEIQRGRWYGFQTVATEDSGYVQDPFLERTDLYKCAGTGDFQYRTRATAYVAGGSYQTPPVNSVGTTRYIC